MTRDPTNSSDDLSSDEAAGASPDLPPALRAALHNLYPPPPAAPQRMDRFILSAARAGMGRRRRHRALARWATAAVASAAVLMLSIHLLPIASRHAAPVAAMSPRADTAARVTIVDAYRVARALADRAPLDKRWDINHDGVVDQRDVDAFARQAVSIPDAGEAR